LVPGVEVGLVLKRVRLEVADTIASRTVEIRIERENIRDSMKLLDI